MAGSIGVSQEKLQETLNTITADRAVMSKKLTAISDGVKELNAKWQSDAAMKLDKISANMAEKSTELDAEAKAFAEFLQGIIDNWEVSETHVITVMEELGNTFHS